MSTAEWKGSDVAPPGCPSLPVSVPVKLHRIRDVREQQGVSIRSVARRLKIEPAEVRALEQETSDMPLSTLYQWQQALDVPISSLLLDSDDSLSDPVLRRARMVRVMKTAMAIREKSGDDGIARMSQMLVEQLVELMPELADVSPWHAVGQRRSLDEMGRAADQVLPDDWFGPST